MTRARWAAMALFAAGAVPAAAAPGQPASSRPGLFLQSSSGGGQPSPAPAPPHASPLAPPAFRPPTPTDPIVARYSAVYDGCMHKAAGVLDMIDCAGRENDRWDARLNRAYQARMTSLNERQRNALKRAQKAWLSFREADCAAYEDDDWGTISKIDASQCVLRRTIERALELEAFPADHGPG